MAAPLPPIAWLDLETGGLDETQHEILEIAVDRVGARSGEELASFHTFVLPTTPPPAEAAAVNGYSADAWRARGAVPLYVALEALAPFLEGGMLAGSHPDFDRRFLAAAYARVGLPFPALGTHRQINLNALAWPLVHAGVVESAGLDALCVFFDVAGEAHRARSDVKRARAVYAHLMAAYGPAVALLAPRRLA